MGWYPMNFPPERQPIEKDEDNNKKLIYILQPGTIADKELQPIVLPSASLLPNLLLAAYQNCLSEVLVSNYLFPPFKMCLFKLPTIEN